MGGCGNCCVMDNPIGDFFKDLFCSDSGCGYHPGPTENEQHMKKVADELAEMKNDIRTKADEDEKKIMDYIQRSINTLIADLNKVNNQTYGGKKLNLDITAIKNNIKQLEQEVIGHIGSIMDDRLVLTDSELSIILEERDDAKRNKNFDAFCKNVKKSAINGLIDKIENTVKQQRIIVENEIKARIKEVEQSMQSSLDMYTEIMDLKTKDVNKLEKSKVEYMYKVGLCDILLDEIGRS